MRWFCKNSHESEMVEKQAIILADAVFEKEREQFRKTIAFLYAENKALKMQLEQLRDKGANASS